MTVFNPRIWFEKTVKGGIKAFLSWLLSGPVSAWLSSLGVVVDPEQAAVGLFALYLSAVNWIKYQPWYGKLPWVVRVLL